MKQIEVVAAIIFDEQGSIFATQRGYGEWKDWWEFPGGKIEAGESREAALKREIHEELDAEIEVGELLRTIEYDYPNFHLTMHCFKCKLADSHVTLLEHEAAKWLKPEELDSVKWLPADEEIINELKYTTINMQTILLNNGIEMPLLGYGLFQVPPQEAERCTRDALEVGYRLIDTAQAYGNEQGVGDAIRQSGIPREDIFIVTKIWITNAGEEKAARSIEHSLSKLQTDYVDLLLIHQAYGDVFGSWRAMEKAYAQGKTRAIGVSNFQACRFYDFASVVDVKPAVNQLQCCVLSQQRTILPEMARFDTKMMAWGPLGQGSDDLLKSPVLAAIGAQYGKTPAQVALRWLIERGIVAIPKSMHKERMATNFDIFDFSLTEADMKAIEPLNQKDTGFRDFADPNYLRRILGMFDLK